MNDEPDLNAVLASVEGFSGTLAKGILDAAGGNHLLGSLILTATVAKVMEVLFPHDQETVLRGICEGVMMRLPAETPGEPPSS